MPRKGRVPKKKAIPDAKYNDVLVTRLINALMKDGKKSIAERVVYNAFDMVNERMKGDPLKTFKKAFDNVKPILEVRSRRVGGATYQVPMEVRWERQVALTLRWIVNYARKRGGKSMVDRLASEIIDAANNRGDAVKKKVEVHKMAEANKAFAHYRW